MFAIKHNIPEIRDKLKRIKLLVTGSQNYQQDVRNQLEWARKSLVRLTPKSDGQTGSQHGKHLRSGWTTHIIGGGAKSRVPIMGVIYNKFTHDAAGEVKGEAWLSSKKFKTSIEATILHILEYGSKPHSIEPVDAQTLHFEVDGTEVFTKHVSHPGTKPYGMVRVTRAKFTHRMRKLAIRWMRKVIDEWRRE